MRYHTIAKVWIRACTTCAWPCRPWRACPGRPGRPYKIWYTFTVHILEISGCQQQQVNTSEYSSRRLWPRSMSSTWGSKGVDSSRAIDVFDRCDVRLPICRSTRQIGAFELLVLSSAKFSQLCAWLLVWLCVKSFARVADCFSRPDGLRFPWSPASVDLHTTDALFETTYSLFCLRARVWRGLGCSPLWDRWWHG